MSAARLEDAERRALQTLGLARRAGRAVLGTRAVQEAGASGQLRAVLVADDAGGRALERLEGAMASGNVAVLRVSSRQRLGEALGREDLVAAGVTDTGFAGLLAELLPMAADARASAARRRKAGPGGHGREG